MSLLKQVLIFCCIGAHTLLFGQQPQLNNLRTRTLNAVIPLQPLDSLTVMPPIYSATDAAGRTINTDFFTVSQNQLRIDTAALRAFCDSCRTVTIGYRVLPYNLSATFKRLDTVDMRRNAQTNAIEYDYTPYEPVSQPWETSTLQSSGAYTRGLSFGNSQNLVFNSNLNLQLNGKLGNDLELVAALSDNSIPLQPDGTTRQLQEFDRIFIQLKRKTHALTAGDYDLTRPDGYFSNYFKRLQGAMWESRWTPSRDTFKLRVAAAVSRGKFSRQLIQGQEGNQGPYRMTGAEGERFIIVLAGTEKVFIDGVQMQRGLDADYTVDYNLGEVAFTTRRLITKDSRIILEFEYAVQTYLRSTTAVNASWRTAKVRTYLNIYSEQDSRTNGGAKDLSPSERRSLAEAGDQLQTAFVSGIDTLAAFDPGRVLYKLKDSIICGTPTPILMYSTNADSARYAARFSEVPPGQGNYVLAQTAANGRVFRWVDPDPLTCQRRGNFEPVIRLIAPEQRQLFTVGTEVQVFKKAKFTAEAALSNRDYNRFSPLGNGDDGGLAFLGVWKQRMDFGKTVQKNQKQWTADLNAQWEQTTRNYQPLNPYRPAEFIRDWNIQNSRDTAAEQLAAAGVSLKRYQWGELRYAFNAFNRKSVYEGQKQTGTLRIQRRGYDLMLEANLLNTRGTIEDSRFSRPKLDVSKTFFRGDSSARKPIFKIGFYGEREKNERRDIVADTLNRAAFWYDLYRVYVQTAENAKRWQWKASAMERHDFAPRLSFFEQSTTAREYALEGLWRSNPEKLKWQQQFNWNVTYRKLQVLAPELTTEKPQNTYLGRIDHQISGLKNAISITNGYELGSGQSPRIEFNYLLVNPGEGQYSWVDRNRDSILQIDEMEVAVFLDQANYVRIAVTTADYERTNNLVLNQNIRLEPRLLWVGSRKRWKKWVGRISSQSTVQTNRRTFADAMGVRVWDPFQQSLNDTALVALNQLVRHVLFVNRAQPDWDASFTRSRNGSQVTLTTGFEIRKNEEWNLHGRVNLNRRWTLESDATLGLRQSDNQAFDTRDFSIVSQEYGPKVTWLPKRTFRIATTLKWKNSKNEAASGEQATQVNANTEITWNPVSKANTNGFKAATSIRAKVTFADIQYQGAPNSTVAFNMLDGLQNGKNILWSFNIDRQLSQSMQLSLNYEGRRTGTRTVHVGRAQVRAIF